MTEDTTPPSPANQSEPGASMIEYGLLLALVMIVVLVAFRVLGNDTSSKISEAASLFR